MQYNYLLHGLKITGFFFNENKHNYNIHHTKYIFLFLDIDALMQALILRLSSKIIQIIIIKLNSSYFQTL